MPDFPTAFAAWSSRKLFLLPPPNSDLPDFPAKVPIVLGSIESIAIGAACLATGYDIRFSDLDGNELPYERDEWSGGGGSPVEAIFWVKTDVSTAGTFIYLLYGNAAAADGQNPEAVWDADFAAVYHMNDATTSTILDSTGNDNDGAKTGANEPIEAAGKIGKGQDFDGANDYINCGADSSLNVGNGSFSVACWAYPVVSTGYRIFAGKRSSGASGWVFYLPPSAGTGILQLNDGTAHPFGIGVLQDDAWQRVWVVVDRIANQAVMYVNGVAGTPVDISAVTGSLDNASDMYIGRDLVDGASLYKGKQDEWSLGMTARSADWIAYEYANMNPADGGLTWGDEEHQPAPAGGGKPMNLKLKL